MHCNARVRSAGKTGRDVLFPEEIALLKHIQLEESVDLMTWTLPYHRYVNRRVLGQQAIDALAEQRAWYNRRDC